MLLDKIGHVMTVGIGNSDKPRNVEIRSGVGNLKEHKERSIDGITAGSFFIEAVGRSVHPEKCIALLLQ